MSRVPDTDNVCLLPLSLVELGLIPFAFCVLLAGPTEALSEELQLFLFCKNFEGCYLMGYFKERLATSVSSCKWAAPWWAKGTMPRPQPLISVEPCVWLWWWSARWPWSSHFASQVTSFLLLALPAYSDRTASTEQMWDSPEVQLALWAPWQVPTRAEREHKTKALYSNSSACTACCSRDLIFMRASCHCKRGDSVTPPVANRVAIICSSIPSGPYQIYALFVS